MKLIYGTSEKPFIKTTDSGIWRRIVRGNNMSIEKIERAFNDLKGQKGAHKSNPALKDIYIDNLEVLLKEAITTAKLNEQLYQRESDRLNRALDRIEELQK